MLLGGLTGTDALHRRRQLVGRPRAKSIAYLRQHFVGLKGSSPRYFARRWLHCSSWSIETGTVSYRLAHARAQRASR